MLSISSPWTLAYMSLPEFFYERVTSEIHQQMARLKQLVATETRQARIVYEVERLANSKLDELAETVQAARDGHFEQAVDIVREGRGRRLMVALRTETGRLLALQDEELQRKRDAAKTQRRHLHYALFAAAALVLGMLAGGVLTSKKAGENAAA